MGTEGGVSGWQYAAKVAFSNIKFGKTLGSTFPSGSTTAAPETTQQPQPSEGVQQLNERCGGDFGNCQPELECVGNVSVCRKPQPVMAFKQLNERCSSTEACSPNGLMCHLIESDYSKCIKDHSFQPPTPAPTPAPTPTPTPAPETNACFVCYHACDDIGQWIQRSGAWDNENAQNCAQTAGNSSCYGFGASMQAVFDSFSSKSGATCARRLSNLRGFFV